MYWVARWLELMDSRAVPVRYLLWSAAPLELLHRNPGPEGSGVVQAP